MAEYHTQTELAAHSEAREGVSLPEYSACAAFARERDITFGKTVTPLDSPAFSAAVRGNPTRVREAAQNRGWAQRLSEAAEESNRQAKASWLGQVARKTDSEPKTTPQLALLRNLNDKELAHHLSQQHGDPTLLEVARRLQRVIDQLDHASSSQYQCHECGARIQGPL